MIKLKKCKSCQKEIDEKATKCPHCQSDQRNWFRKHPVLTVILALIVLGVVASSGSNKDTSNTSSTNEAKEAVKEAQNEPERSKEWVTVTELKGNANKRSDTFELTGNKARLTYEVSGNNSVIASIYVLKEGMSLEKDGGFPEVMISEPSSDTTYLTKNAGTYYLDITSANSSWTVKIEEER